MVSAARDVESGPVVSVSAEPVLTVTDLKTHFVMRDRVVHAVDGISLEVGQGETLAIVGESGSGKTVTGLSILRLVPEPGRILGGSILLDGTDLLTLSERAMENVRGPGATMVFQNPRTALDPFFRLGDQLLETIVVKRGMSKADAGSEMDSLMRMVRVQDAERVLGSYPHEVSGGTCQRVMLAMALACRPKLLIADEPTTLLDAHVQSEILELIDDLKSAMGMSVILITHDFGVVARLADSIAVMYGGQIVETGRAAEVLSTPQHPYSIALINSVPRINRDSTLRLMQIEGQPPDLARLPAGCRFAARCPEAVAFCREDHPALKEVAAGRFARCHFRGEVPAAAMADAEKRRLG